MKQKKLRYKSVNLLWILSIFHKLAMTWHGNTQRIWWDRRRIQNICSLFSTPRFTNIFVYVYMCAWVRGYACVCVYQLMEYIHTILPSKLWWKTLLKPSAFLIIWRQCSPSLWGLHGPWTENVGMLHRSTYHTMQYFIFSSIRKIVWHVVATKCER